MGKDSKLKIDGFWLVLAFIVIACFVWYKSADAIELEVGPTFLSGEFAEGGMLVLSAPLSKRWYLGGGYTSKQQCHCRYPADLDENIFFQVQHRAQWKLLEIGIGPAYWQNTNRALGKNLTWSLSMGLVGEHWSVRLRHFSNAGSGTPNLGQDALTIGYAF